MEDRWSIDIEFLEQGDIFFFYKLKKGVKSASSIDDVSRFYFVLSPTGNNPRRYIVMGKKRMPYINDGGKTGWGFIEKVGGRGYEVSKESRSKKATKRGARPVGEGLYSIARHRDHTHLFFVLELPKRPGEVQNALNIKRRGDFIFNIQTEEDKGGNKFIPVSDSNALNIEGRELLLTGVGANLSRLGIKVDSDIETEETAEIFTRLKVDKTRHPISPLIKGEWA